HRSCTSKRTAVRPEHSASSVRPLGIIRLIDWAVTRRRRKRAMLSLLPGHCGTLALLALAGGLVRLQVGDDRLTGNGGLVRRHQRRHAFGEVDVEAAAKADQAEYLAGANRLVELHIADDAPRHHAGDLHHADVDA